MVFGLFKRKKAIDPPVRPAAEGDASVELKGRSVTRHAVPEIGASILELAERNKVDWLSSCKRGTCARCRCLVSEGMELLSAPNEAELERLESEEIAKGYRLGCQAKIEAAGKIAVKHASYF